MQGNGFRSQGKSENSPAHRNFTRQINGNPAVSRNIYGLSNGHIDNIRPLGSFVDRMDREGVKGQIKPWKGPISSAGTPNKGVALSRVILPM